MKSKTSKQEIWKREAEYARRPEYWRAFALETKCCAEFLLAKFEKAWRSDEPDEDLKGFFGWKFVRMQWGYALENLVKGLLLSGPNLKVV